MSSLGGPLALLVVGQRLGLDGVGAEEEELLAGDQVPGDFQLAQLQLAAAKREPRVASTVKTHLGKLAP